MNDTTNFNDIDQFCPEVTELNESPFNMAQAKASSLSCHIGEPGVFVMSC